MANMGTANPGTEKHGYSKPGYRKSCTPDHAGYKYFQPKSEKYSRKPAPQKAIK